MRISVVIPTRPADDGTVDRCLAGLLPQLRASDEVIVSADGPSDGFGAARDAGAIVLTGPRVGPGGAKNRALEHAQGDIVLFLNDDVIPQAGLLEAHREAHAVRDRTEPAIVLGSAPWRVPDDDRVIDCLLRETSMIFFYDRMNPDDAERDWGFRHAWTLNLSVPGHCVSDFDDRLAYPMFDDLEWAFRVQAVHRAPVLFRPEAAVEHVHRYTPRMLLRREALLGHQAFRLREINRPCFQAVFADRFDADYSVDEHGARSAFAALTAEADDPASRVNDSQVARLFESCAAWRDAARRIGFRAATVGMDAIAAQADVEERLAETAIAARA